MDLIAIRDGVLITPILKKILRLIGCEKCFGKGYGTKTEFAESGYGSGRHRWKLPIMVFCDCDRGKQLMKLWHEGELIMIKHYEVQKKKEKAKKKR